MRLIENREIPEWVVQKKQILEWMVQSTGRSGYTNTDTNTYPRDLYSIHNIIC